jgi:hypothetical protein
MTTNEVIQKIAAGNPGLVTALLQCQSDCEDWAILFQDLLELRQEPSVIYAVYKYNCDRDSFKFFTEITGRKSSSEKSVHRFMGLSWLWGK